MAASLPARRALAAGAEAGFDRIEWLLAAGDTDVQQIVAARTPDLSHGVIRGNPKRVWKALALNEPFCTADVFVRREYADKIYFTPTVLSLPPVLMAWPNILPILPRTVQGPVLLPALLTHTELQGVAVSGRNYGEAVNAMIEQRPRKNALTLLESNLGSARAAEMLLTRRVDYLIAYSGDLEVADPSLPRVSAGARPAALAIDGATELAPAGVACPRTPWGLAAMRRIDAALSAPESVAALRIIQERYMPEAERRRHAAELQAFFNARSRPMAGLEAER